MKRTIYVEYSTDGIQLFPIVNLSWGSSWSYFKIQIGWLFWFVEIEWPIE